MAKIIWAPSALKDIDLIAEYISRDSIDRASLLIDRLFEVTDNLQDYPQLGRIIPEIGNENCREIIYDPYRIMYRIENDELWITGVIHGARDWKPE